MPAAAHGSDGTQSYTKLVSNPRKHEKITRMGSDFEAFTMHTASLESATRELLAPTGLDLHDLETVLGKLCGRGVDLCDLYFEYVRTESWSLEDSRVKAGSFALDQGVGVRAVTGERTGFAYSDALSLTALHNAAQAARAITAQGQDKRVQVDAPLALASLYSYEDPLTRIEADEKITLLQNIDRRLRNADPRVREVNASLIGSHTHILYVAADGTLAADVRPLVRLNCSVIVEQQGRRETARFGGGGRHDYQPLMRNNAGFDIADEALRQALCALEAIAAPAGEMTVVLGPGWPGILLHEAIGHGLEGDFNRKGTSAFSGRLGDRVASDACTVVDDATLPLRRGSLSVDDEGTPGQRTVLIENGILKGYLQDKHNARLMGVASTGNGRRQSYAHRPLPRMTNTVMLAGEREPEEIIAAVERGLYAVNFGGGQVDITNGKFVFAASEAYLIEGGKISAPVKGATLIGNGPDVLTRVTAVGNDLALDNGVGTCGKDGQSVPVGVGQPTLRIDGLTVGGTTT